MKYISDSSNRSSRTNLQTIQQLTMSSNHVINFGAGPAKLPRQVLEQARDEILNCGCGLSVMELSHRSAEYAVINNRVIESVRQLLNVPSNYKILLMQGGGTGAFASVPLNLMHRGEKADFILTGEWSTKAAKETSKYMKVNYVFPKPEKFEKIPDQSTWKLDPEAAFVYYCDNETVNGIEFPFIPETNGVPLVCDMSSNIMTRKFNVSKFGIVFACAQKNLGPAGITVIIIRDDLIGHPSPICPMVFNYTLFAHDDSLVNTPPTFIVYMLSLVLKWIKEQGGVGSMEEQSKTKSQLLYKTIEDSKGFYSCPIDSAYRSRVTVPFRLSTGPEADKQFLKESQDIGFLQLKGHRLVGGIRVAMYNAMTLDEVKVLTDFMIKFQEQHPQFQP
ncbi:probable phosphoserine aminotransferase isoform X2 [Daktulosphaira vitifoliae]|uniref:probable phosphoserine aminotransferase isoform X2 n=1 Tax=Daktulosphaira vitifoliae TaxID=58002 RepID=UPI0021AA9D32|nr:probable phosphoserine aminotransferase isoform X2 [Daktulosphaira vitifoliae]